MTATAPLPRSTHLLELLLHPVNERLLVSLLLAPFDLLDDLEELGGLGGVAELATLPVVQVVLKGYYY